MHIKSPFVDYYDWVQNIDPIPGDVVYDRSPMAQSNPLGERPNLFGYKPELLCYFSDFSLPNRLDRKFEQEYIVVSDALYVRHFDSEFKKKVLTKTNSNPESILALSRMVGQPVFRIADVIHSYNWGETRKFGESERITIVDRKIPILADYGFPKIEDSHVMFSKIDYFVRNLKYENPDITPATPMENKDKIVSHGFDLKQSFRHRN